MVPEGAMKMKHIRVERCCDCPYFNDWQPRDGGCGLNGFCGINAKYLLDKKMVAHDCPLEDDHTLALMAALELLLKKPKTLAEMRYPSECEYANAEALAVLDAAKSARPQSSGGGR